jgi:RNA polymerase sigma-70 factor (family 1)
MAFNFLYKFQIAGMITDGKELSDRELFQAISSDDSLLAFNTLFKRYWKRLYAIACAQLGDEQEAKDCVQDLFVSLWTKRNSMTLPLSVPAYLHTSIKNSTLNRLHARVLMEQHQFNYVDRIKTISNFDSNKLEQEELASIIQEEIEKMPDQMRRIYLLSRENNMSGQEIADLLELSPQTVRNQISMSISRLKTRIKIYQFN